MTATAQAKSKKTNLSPAVEYLRGLSIGESRRTTASALRQVLAHLCVDETIETFQWHKLTMAEILAARDSLSSSVAPGTANRYLASLRGVLRACWKQRILSMDEYERLSDFPDIRGSRKTKRRALAQIELRKLFEGATRARTPWIAARDHALTVLLYSSGIRRSELVRIHLCDVEFEPDGVRIRVIGKNNKERDTWSGMEVRGILERWVAIRGDWNGVLFPGKRGGKRPFSPQCVSHKMRAIAKKANLGVVTPHDLRRTCLTTLLDEGADLLAVRDLAGHASIATTALYDLRGERAARAAARKLPMPF